MFYKREEIILQAIKKYRQCKEHSKVDFLFKIFDYKTIRREKNKSAVISRHPSLFQLSSTFKFYLLI